MTRRGYSRGCVLGDLRFLRSRILYSYEVGCIDWTIKQIRNNKIKKQLLVSSQGTICKYCERLWLYLWTADSSFALLPCSVRVPYSLGYLEMSFKR